MARLDLYLVSQNLFPTRTQAQLAINSGKIRVNGQIVTKNGYDVFEQDEVIYDKPEYTFVSFGGYKLLKAIQKFNLDINGKTCLDIGASTGGFTDCLLQFGAKKVYAYDVGHNQLAESLRTDPRVTFYEGINGKNLKKSDFVDSIDFICMDVSFISCTKMFSAISDILSTNGEAVILYKPQFEVGNKYINRQGIVKDDKIIKEKMMEIINYALTFNLKFIDSVLSAEKQEDNNREYLLYFIKI